MRTISPHRHAGACLQLYGGYGYMKEYGVSRACEQRIYGGTSEIKKELISRSLLS